MGHRQGAVLIPPALWLVLAGIAAGAGCCGALLTEVIAGRLWARQHECRLRPVAATAVDGLAGFGQTSTHVLLRCPVCEQIEATTLPGRWTLAQVQGRNLADVADTQPAGV